MVMVVLSVKHDRVVPVPVAVTDPNSDAPDPDFDAFRDDHWFIADVQRTGKCRHRQERNKKKGKQSILHGTLFGWGRSTPRYPPACSLGTLRVCIGLTNIVVATPLRNAVVLAFIRMRSLTVAVRSKLLRLESVHIRLSNSKRVRLRILESSRSQSKSTALYPCEAAGGSRRSQGRQTL
jgi:hypothetical protein